MERKIGEIFEYNGEWYQCMKSNTCKDCAFYRSSCGSLNGKGSCSYNFRKDATNVIFKKLEKIGEPFIIKGKKYQRYITHVHPYILNELSSIPIDDSSVLIEIKQTQEDMEEKKLNLKPFDIQKAREGKPVCTRDGRKARIICFDVKGDICPIIALVEENGMEVTKSYDVNGRANYKNADNYDLMMLPEKKEGWVNVYKGGLLDIKSYPTKKESFDKAYTEGYVDTVKIQWEE